MAANANKAVVVNGTSTGLTTTAGTLALAGNFSTLGAFAVALTVTAGTALTLPTTGTLATLAGSEAFTNKTLTTPAVTTSLTTGSTTFALLNTTATTVNAFGAATTLNIGNSGGTTTALGNWSIGGTLSAQTGTMTSAVLVGPLAGDTTYGAISLSGNLAGSLVGFYGKSGSSLYSAVPTAGHIYGVVNSSVVTDTSSTGLAVTGTLSATGSISAAGQFTSTYAGGGGSGAAIYLNSASPAITLRQSGAGTDQKKWDQAFTGTGVMSFRTINDNEGAATNWLTVTRDSGYGITSVAIPSVWANTGGTTAVMVDSAGVLWKLASARKYKMDFAPYTKGLADVLKLDPQYYRVKSQGEGSHLYAGLIADDLDAQGLSEFVAYGPEGVDSINYGHMAALFTNAIKELVAKNESLTARITALEAK